MADFFTRPIEVPVWFYVLVIINSFAFGAGFIGVWAMFNGW